MSFVTTREMVMNADTPGSSPTCGELTGAETIGAVAVIVIRDFRCLIGTQVAEALPQTNKVRGIINLPPSGWFV